MQHDKLFYEVYKFGDRLQPGERMELEHHISFRDYYADLAPLVSQPLGQLSAQKEASVKAERLREVMEKLETGVGAVFESERYAAYLQTMSKFHRYSFNNVLFIALKYPAASHGAPRNPAIWCFPRR